MPTIYWRKESPDKPGILKRFLQGAGCFPALFACGLLACSPASREATRESLTGVEQRQPQAIPRDSLYAGSGWVGYFPRTCPDDTIPVVLGLDPNGRAAEGVLRYRQPALENGIFLCFSTESRNGLPVADSRVIVRTLVETTRTALPGKTLRFFLMGFSGGARVAFEAASGLPAVQGILYTGAAGSGPLPGIPLWGLAGEGDMNRVELYTFHARLPEAQPAVLLDHPGKHEWPEAGHVGEWFRWVRAVSGNAKASRLASYRDHVLDRARRENNVTIRAALLGQAVFLEETGGLLPSAAGVWERLRRQAAFQAAEQQQWRSFRAELDWRDRYGKAFMEKDWAWWSREIALLRAHTRLPGEPAVQERLLGYFSLVSYSLSRQMLAGADRQRANIILNIYRASDPENPEAWYLSAVGAALDQDRAGAIEFLGKAAAKGFAEWDRARSQPEFSDFRSDPGFLQLLSGFAK
jgi:hypothetical protein